MPRELARERARRDAPRQPDPFAEASRRPTSSALTPDRPRRWSTSAGPAPRPRHRLSPADLAGWESGTGDAGRRHRARPHGWGQYWPREALPRERRAGYTANCLPRDRARAAEWLARERRSTRRHRHGEPRPRPVQNFIAHQVLNGANIYGWKTLPRSACPSRGDAPRPAMRLKEGRGPGADHGDSA